MSARGSHAWVAGRHFSGTTSALASAFRFPLGSCLFSKHASSDPHSGSHGGPGWGTIALGKIPPYMVMSSRARGWTGRRQVGLGMFKAEGARDAGKCWGLARGVGGQPLEGSVSKAGSPLGRRSGALWAPSEFRVPCVVD